MTGALVAGEALVDLVIAPDGAEVSRHLGGGPFTAARALARLGVPTRFLGAFSTDADGVRLRDALTADDVDVDAAPVVARPTPIARARMDPDGHADYTFVTAGTAAPALDVAAALRAVGDPAALHVGSLGLVLEPLADAVEAVVAHLRGRALVLLDPNCRPAAVPDAAAHRARLSRVAAQVDVVKASVEDLAWWWPGLAPQEAARALVTAGPRVVLVTDGPRGADLLLAGGGEVHVDAPVVAVADTIGAGDAFGAAFVAACLDMGPAALTDRDAVSTAATFACRAAALTCARPGADPPRAADVGPVSS